MTPALTVTDPSSNRPGKNANFAELLKGAPVKIKLASLIYRGKKRTKTVAELATAMKKSRKEILTLATPLASQGLFEKVKADEGGKSLTAYSKIDSVSANIKLILRLARDGKKLEQYVTKANPKNVVKTTITIRTVKPARARACSILDLDQFKKAKAVKLASAKSLTDRLPDPKRWRSSAPGEGKWRLTESSLPAPAPQAKPAPQAR
jgi:hypothetical protein